MRAHDTVRRSLRVGLLVAMGLVPGRLRIRCRTGETSPPASRSWSVAACAAGSLAVRGGRQGGGGYGSVHADVDVTNTGRAACRLTGAPTIHLVTARGSMLEVRQQVGPGEQGRLRAVDLAPGGAARLVLSWVNWCRADPGPLRVHLALPAGAGKVTGGFDGPTDGTAVLGCLQSRRPSTREALDAYLPGPALSPSS